MNFAQLKQDAKHSLSLANPSPHRVTCLYWCVILAVIVLGEGSVYMLESGTNGVSGISAITARNSTVMVVMLISFAMQLLTTVWSASYNNYSLALSRNEEGVGFEKLTQGFTRFFSILLLLILEYILVMLWSFLFIIPGLVAIYRYRYALLILLDNPGLSPIEAINRSKAMTRGHKMQIFLLDFHLLWYQILISVGSVAFLCYSYELTPLPITDWNTYVLMAITYLFTMLVDILFMPYYQCTFTNGYLWVKSQQEAPKEPVEAQ